MDNTATANLRKALRSAREALAKKDFRGALGNCKDALHEDRSCYEAYLYIGKAAFHLREFQQAAAAYQRAAELDEQNSLAWQGLAEVYSEDGKWGEAVSTYERLLELCNASSDEALKAKSAVFQRRLAEALFQAGDAVAAELMWQHLSEQDVERSPPEQLEILCRLADAQLAVDSQYVEYVVEQRMQEALEVAAQSGDNLPSDASLRIQVEGEVAEEALVIESDKAASTLQQIIAQAPPNPIYVPYHDAFLRRLRKSIQAFPVGSMSRHNRRVATLTACRTIMAGRLEHPAAAGSSVGGCCSPFAFETALSMLEVEHEVTVGPSSVKEGESDMLLPIPLILTELERIAKKLMHSFPTNASASVHLALCLRRRELDRTAGHAAPSGRKSVDGRRSMDGRHAPSASSCGPCAATKTNLNDMVPHSSMSCKLQSSDKRHFITRELLNGLQRGGRSVAGWVAVADLLQKQGAPRAALDAAKQGLRYVAERELLGKEHMGQAALLLRLIAGRALLQAGQLDEAEGFMLGLCSGGVSEGTIGFGELAGLGEVMVHHQAIRGLAQVALARGHRNAARQHYEDLLGRELLGRAAASTAKVEAWVHAEYGWLLMEDGELQAALTQLDKAMEKLPSGEEAEHAIIDGKPVPVIKANYRFMMGRVKWELGGHYRADKLEAHADFLAAAGAAAINTPSATADAFTWLGHWYQEVEHDQTRAQRCYERALQHDLLQPEAGEELCNLLEASDQRDAARDLCGRVLHHAAETAPRDSDGGAAWARRRLALLELRAASGVASLSHANAAVAHFQQALRHSPQDAELWEGLGAAYHSMGRHTSAVKAYRKALDVQPRRLFSLLQYAALQYHLGSVQDAIGAFRAALTLAPLHPVALLGAAEALLDSAHTHARLGAQGAAAAELAEAAELATRCTLNRGNLQPAWKLLGDIHVQHVTTTPVTHQPLALTQASPALVRLATPGNPQSAMQARLATMQAARRAYSHALHLDPLQAHVWGDLASSLHHHATLMRLMPQDSRQPVQELLTRASSLVRGGLRLSPSSDRLWGTLGSVEADPSVREYAWSRALQLNPKRASIWADLGRLYTRHGEGATAAKCFEQARAHEPTAVGVWEGMAHLSASAALRPGDAAHAEAAQFLEHAVGLGGDLESRLGVATDAVMSGDATAARHAYSCASRAVVQLPLLAAAHNTLGQAASSLGRHAEALSAFQLAESLLVNGHAAASAELGALPPPYSTVPWDPEDDVLGAVRVNAATALANVGGRAPEALARFDALQQAHRELLAKDGRALTARAHALKEVGRPHAEVVQAFQTALGACRAPSHRLMAVAALMQYLLEQRKWDGAYSLVLAETLGEDGVKQDAYAARGALMLWTSLLTGVILGDQTQMMEDVATNLREWAMARPHLVDEAAVQAHIASCRAAHLATAGQPLKAARTLCAAIHSCPWATRGLRVCAVAYALQDDPARYAVAAVAATPQSQPAALTPLCGAELAQLHQEHQVHTSGLLSTLANRRLMPHLRAELGRLARLVHAYPAAAGFRSLLALTALQLATVVGQATAYRTALRHCIAACALVKRELAASPAQAAAAAATAPPSSPAVSLASVLPVMQIYAAKVSAAQPSAADAGGTLSPDERRALVSLQVRLVVALSECHLHARLGTNSGGDGATAAEGSTTAAAAYADEAVQLAEASGTDVALAQRQVARVLLAQRDTAGAAAAYAKAIQSGDRVALLEQARSLTNQGRPEEAAQLLQTHGLATAGRSAPGHLSTVVQLESALLMTEVGELQSAKTLLDAVLSTAKDDVRWTMPAHVLRANLTLSDLLLSAPDELGDEAERKLLLAARKDVGEVLRSLPAPQMQQQLRAPHSRGNSGNPVFSRNNSGGAGGLPSRNGSGGLPPLAPVSAGASRGGSGAVSPGAGARRSSGGGGFAPAAVAKTGPGTAAAAALLMAQIEQQRGKHDRVVAALEQAAETAGTPTPAPLLGALAKASAITGGSSNNGGGAAAHNRAVWQQWACAVHQEPWQPAMWDYMGGSKS